MKITKIEIHCKSNIPWRLGAILIAPGLNVVTQAEYDFVKDNAMFQRMVEVGNMEVLFREVEPQSHSAIKSAVSEVVSSTAPEIEKTTKHTESLLGSLSNSEAKELITASDSVEELESFKVGESRKRILVAIDERLKVLSGAEQSSSQ